MEGNSNTAKQNSKTRVAVIFLGRKGGGPAYSLEMTKGLIENGCEVYLFISKYVENLTSWLALRTKRTEIIKTYKGKFSFVINSIFFRFFESKKIRKKYKNVHVNACYIPMGHSWDPYIINSLQNPQKIVTIHDPIHHSSNNSNDSMYARAVSFLNKGVFDKKPDDIIILSSCFFDHVLKQGTVGRNHIHIIPHCIFDQYESLSTHAPRDYDQTKINFLFFGRIDKYKGIDILGEAYKKYYKKNKNVTLTIAGSGDFSIYKDLYLDIPNLDLQNRWIPDEEVASFFAPNKNVILVLPYLDATQSGVVPIAMSIGIPIIASNAGGLSEQIDDNVTGFLFEAGSVEALEKKMLEVSSRNNEKIIASAKAHISSLSGKNLTKKIIEIIKN